MILQQLIRYTNADAPEATWADADGNIIRCHAYSNHPEQIAQLRADLGADAAQYEELIAEVEATYVPPEPQPIPVPQQIARAQGKAAAPGLHAVPAGVHAPGQPPRASADRSRTGGSGGQRRCAVAAQPGQTGTA